MQTDHGCSSRIPGPIPRIPGGFCERGFDVGVYPPRKIHQFFSALKILKMN